VVRFMLRPPYLREESPVPTEWWVDGAPEPVWTFCGREETVHFQFQLAHSIRSSVMTPCVLHLLNMGSITPSYDGLEPAWRVGWPRRLLVDFPGGSGCLEAAHREVPCPLSYGALF